MKRFETDLRKALDEEINSYRFEIALSGYIASSRLVETTGNLIFDRTILVTVMTDSHHREDARKMKALVSWLKEASAFQKKIDDTLIRADQRLVNAALDKQKKLATKK